MLEEKDKDERTESATPRRREEARRKGQVARSTDLTSAFMFLIAIIALRFLFSYLFSEILNISRHCWSLDKQSLISHSLLFSLKHIGLVLMPMSLILIISALTINFFQVGFLMSGEALMPKYERINPIKGASRLISKKTLIAFIQSLLKLFIVGYVLYITLKSEKDKIIGLSDIPIKMSISYIASIIFKMSIRAALIIFVLALFDYAYQRWEYEQSLKMTKQEVKEEYKETEGDPLIKSRIRSIQREMATRRMMQEIPKADVVITNPTKLAVVLKYNKETDLAPKVCAKGARLIAERIKAIAREHDIPIIEDKPLARALFKLELGWEIPIELYKAVAEILARVYRMGK